MSRGSVHLQLNLTKPRLSVSLYIPALPVRAVDAPADVSQLLPCLLRATLGVKVSDRSVRWDTRTSQFELRDGTKIPHDSSEAVRSYVLPATSLDWPLEVLMVA